jgi:hypothetical protein
VRKKEAVAHALRTLLFALSFSLSLGAIAHVQSAPLTIDAILRMTGPSAFLGHDRAIALDVYEQLVNRTGGVRGRPLHFATTDLRRK